MSTHKKNNSEKKSRVGLGETTDSGYKYSSRINFKEDLSVQIKKLMQEKKAKDELGNHIEKIRKIVLLFKDKRGNLDYYYTLGKAMLFLSNSSNFHNIKPYSVFRRIIDEIPDILPGQDPKRIQDHLMMMHRIGDLDKNILEKATWEQWYEISKFNKVIGTRKILEKVLSICGNSSGSALRGKIESILDGRNQNI